MGIMLILKGATYTPTETPNPGSGGTTGGGTSQWQTLAPTEYREFSTAHLNKISRAALEEKNSVHRLVVFWLVPQGCTAVKLHLPLLYPDFSFEFNEIYSIPVDNGITTSTYYSEYVINYHPDDADPNEWYDPTPSLTDCIFTPTQDTTGLCFNLCLRSAHGAITDEHIAQIINILDQIIEVR